MAFLRSPRTQVHVPQITSSPEQASLVAAYSVLASRYASTTAFQWQVPAFGAAAEAALLAGNLNSDLRMVHVTLAAIALAIAPAAVGVMRRAELTAWWDRALMDAYEVHLAIPPTLRLHHEKNLHQRLAERDFLLNRSARSLKLQLALVRLAPPSLLLAFSLMALAFANVAVAIVNL